MADLEKVLRPIQQRFSIPTMPKNFLGVRETSSPRHSRGRGSGNLHFKISSLGTDEGRSPENACSNRGGKLQHLPGPGRQPKHAGDSRDLAWPRLFSREVRIPRGLCGSQISHWVTHWAPLFRRTRIQSPNKRTMMMGMGRGRGLGRQLAGSSPKPTSTLAVL